jgi:hypothetical protein
MKFDGIVLADGTHFLNKFVNGLGDLLSGRADNAKE